MRMQKKFALIIILYSAVPLFSFILSLIGLYVNVNFMYILLVIPVLYSFSVQKKTRSEKYFFLILLISIFYNILFSILNDGLINGISNGMKIFKNYYLFIFIGFIVYKIYCIHDNLDLFYKLIVKIGAFIAIFNLLLAIDTYVHTLGLASSVRTFIDIHYPNYLSFILSSVGLNRPAGYFFDLHSQTYLPMAALFLLLLKTTVVKYQRLIIIILLFSILLSSIRISYAMLVIFGFSILLIKKQKPTFWILLFIFLIGMFWYFAEYILMFFDQIRGVRGNSVNIAGNHLVTIPFLLWDESIITFFFGGNSSLRSQIYSEVYLWTLLFYIGLIGLVFYILPVFLVFNYKKYKVGVFFILYMLVSLLHYKVYNTGVNIFVSSIGYVYFFDILKHIKIGRIEER